MHMGARLFCSFLPILRATLSFCLCHAVLLWARVLYCEWRAWRRLWPLAIAMHQSTSSSMSRMPVCVCVCACACVCVRVCVCVCVTIKKVPDEWQARQAIPAILQVRSSKHNANKNTIRGRGPFHQSITVILTGEKRKAIANPTHVTVYLFRDQDWDRSSL